MSQPASEENYQAEVEEFFDTLHGDQTGYLYVPTKLDTGRVDEKGNPVFDWEPKFFKYPRDKSKAAKFVIEHADTHDCYVAPSMFKAPNPDKKAWKGSNYVWIEFDGNAPTDLPDGVPSPSVRIQSSTDGHEHWYWKLNEFCTDRDALEGLSKQLTYTLDADKSGWDCTQVLRPPGSLHQESRRRVRILSQGSDSHEFADFRNLVDAPREEVVSNVGEIPDIQDVIAKYKWDKDALDLFRKKTIEVGKRSSAMTRLAFECVEMGMTNEECYSVLYNADERWGKFKSRTPAERSKRLLGLITHCRSKKEVQVELGLADRDSFVSLGDFEQLEVRVSWLYEGLLTERGLGTISAQPGVGKSTISINLGLAAVLHKPFLKWACTAAKQQRVGFVSLEMAGDEVNKMIIQDMKPRFNNLEWDVIKENFFVLPLGYPLALGDSKEQNWMLDQIDTYGLNFIIIDSLKGATGLDDKKMDKFYEWINKHVRNERGCTVWIVHHNRKPSNEGPRKPRGLEDLYGDQYISAYATTVVSLWRRSKNELEVLPFKVRLAPEIDPFIITRTEHLGFAVSDKSISDEVSDGEVKEQPSRGLFG